MAAIVSRPLCATRWPPSHRDDLSRSIADEAVFKHMSCVASSWIL